MTFSKCKKALAAITIATALTGVVLVASPVDFSSTTVAYAATPSIDFNQVDTAIARYNALNEADYTATSWQKLKEIDSKVQQMAAMVAQMNTMSDAEIEENGAPILELQSQLNQFANAVNLGIDKVLVEKSEVVTLDYTAINAAIARYKGLKQSDYTPESWAAFQASLVYENGTPVDMPTYISGLEALQALSPDELVYLLRETSINATDLQNELNQNASALNVGIDLLVAGSTEGDTTPFSGTLPTTSEPAPTGAVAKTNVVKESSFAPLLLLVTSAMTVLGSAVYKIRKEN